MDANVDVDMDADVKDIEMVVVVWIVPTMALVMMMVSGVQSIERDDPNRHCNRVVPCGVVVHNVVPASHAVVVLALDGGAAFDPSPSPFPFPSPSPPHPPLWWCLKELVQRLPRPRLSLRRQRPSHDVKVVQTRS